MRSDSHALRVDGEISSLEAASFTISFLLLRAFLYCLANLGRRKFIYAQDLTTLREKEKQLIKDQLDGLDIYVAGKANLNDTFDRYMSTKCKLRETTRSNYIYIYDRFVRDTFGKKKIAEVKYSDVLQFYLHLLNVDDLSLGTLDSVKQQLRIFVLW